MATSKKDFPFYNAAPIALRPAQWGLLMLAVAAGFATLYLPLGESPFLHLIPAILFPAIPLLTLRAMVGPHWRVLFSRLRAKDILLAFGIALVNLLVTGILGALVLWLFGANANPVFGTLTSSAMDDRLLFALRTLPQLLGEELLTILPFLALLTLLTSKARLSRRSAIVVAWVATAFLFGLVHLPTYEWNWMQCIVIIGSARLVLSLAYFWTKNVWVSTLAHIINDWTLFGVGLLLTGVGVHA